MNEETIFILVLIFFGIPIFTMVIVAISAVMLESVGKTDDEKGE